MQNVECYFQWRSQTRRLGHALFTKKIIYQKRIYIELYLLQLSINNDISFLSCCRLFPNVELIVELTYSSNMRFMKFNAPLIPFTPNKKSNKESLRNTIKVMPNFFVLTSLPSRHCDEHAWQYTHTHIYIYILRQEKEIKLLFHPDKPAS